MCMKLKYKKYKAKYLNLKKLYGGTNDLEYYNKYVELNSFITIYGEIHDLEYNVFLLKYINYLYSTDRRDRKQIIIIEKNKSELMSINSLFNMFMEETPNKDYNIKRKHHAIRLEPQPITYFSAVYAHGGKFPNTEIICGDIRLRKIFNLLIELEEMSELHPKNIINIEFLKKFKVAWEEQLSLLTASEYLIIKDEITALLSEILPTMTNEGVNEINHKLNVKWTYLTNISMLQYIIQHIKEDKEGIDITLFVGALHMENLIEEIEKLYPSLNDVTLVHETSTNYIQSPKLSNQDDNFDTDEEYSSYWFIGKKRLTGSEIKPETYYSIRFKNNSYAFTNYKLIEYKGDKIILEQKDGMHDQKIIELDINNIYAY